MKVARKTLQKIIQEELSHALAEVAPPGREDQVKALKGKVDNPYAVAWAQHKKHGKPKNEVDELAEEDDPMDSWTDAQAQQTWGKMGGDFDQVVKRAEGFAEDPHEFAADLQKKATGKWPTQESRHLRLVGADPDGDEMGYDSPEDLAALYADFEEEGFTGAEEAEDLERWDVRDRMNARDAQDQQDDEWDELTRQGRHLSVVEKRIFDFFMNGPLREGTPDIQTAARDFLHMLRSTVPATYDWMRFRTVKTEPQWSEVTALHGFIPREYRHSDEETEDMDWDSYYAWEDATEGVIDAMSAKYPGIEFTTARNI